MGMPLLWIYCAAVRAVGMRGSQRRLKHHFQRFTLNKLEFVIICV